MTDPTRHPAFCSPTVASDAELAAPQPFSAARLMAGGLSLLLVLALALAAGVPAGQLLATVGGSTHGDVDRAVAPQVVERQERRLAQERPVPAGAERVATDEDRFRCPLSAGSVGKAEGSPLLREALLALPPPHAAA